MFCKGLVIRGEVVLVREGTVLCDGAALLREGLVL